MLADQIPAPSQEVKALTSALADVLSSLKQGQGALAAAQAALPDLIAAAGNVANIGANIKLPHNQAYIAWGIAQVYEAEGANA